MPGSRGFYCSLPFLSEWLCQHECSSSEWHNMQLKKAFGALLADGAAFYRAMAYKLELVYGHVGYKPTTRELGIMAQQIADIKPADTPISTNVSVHRCLICIGDLTRYWNQADLPY